MRPFALLLAAFCVPFASAQIVLKPGNKEAVELTPKTVRIDAKVEAAIADVTWTYTFSNAARWSREADFLIAIPLRGVVTGFATRNGVVRLKTR